MKHTKKEEAKKTVYRVIETVRNEFAPEKDRITKKVIWEGDDAKDLNRLDLSNRVEKGYLHWSYSFEVMLKFGFWQQWQDPRLGIIYEEIPEIDDDWSYPVDDDWDPYKEDYSEDEYEANHDTHESWGEAIYLTLPHPQLGSITYGMLESEWLWTFDYWRKSKTLPEEVIQAQERDFKKAQDRLEKYDDPAWCYRCNHDTAFCSCRCSACNEYKEDCECTCALCDTPNVHAYLCPRCEAGWNRAVQGNMPYSKLYVSNCKECGIAFNNEYEANYEVDILDERVKVISRQDKCLRCR